MTCKKKIELLNVQIKQLKRKYKKQIQSIKKKMAIKLRKVKNKEISNSQSKILNNKVSKITNDQNAIKKRQKENEYARQMKIKSEELNKKLSEKNKEYKLELTKRQLQENFNRKQKNIQHKLNLNKIQKRTNSTSCDSMSSVFNKIENELMKIKNTKNRKEIINKVLTEFNLTSDRQISKNATKYEGILLISKDFHNSLNFYLTPIYTNNNIERFCMYSKSSVKKISKTNVQSLASSRFEKIYVYHKKL